MTKRMLGDEKNHILGLSCMNFQSTHLFYSQRWAQDLIMFLDRSIVGK